MAKGLIVAVAALAFFALAHTRADAAASCQFSSASIAFGNFDVYGPALAITGSIQGVCTSGASNSTRPIISLNKGLHSTVFSPRKMACASGACSTGYSADLLQYNLYTSATYSTIWGDGTNSTATVQLASGCCSNNVAWSATVYGNIPKAVAGGTNDVSVGVYADTVTVTMTF